MGVAGTPCRPFTLYGHHETLSHVDMEAWYLWVNEMSCLDLDQIILENSEHFMKPLLAEGLPSKYDIKHTVFGSPDQGWPVRRSRLYAYCLNQDSLVWIGPSECDITVHFLAVVWAGLHH